MVSAYMSVLTYFPNESIFAPKKKISKVAPAAIAQSNQYDVIIIIIIIDKKKNR